MVKQSLPSFLQTVSHTAGVYVFKTAQGEVIYIGKAKNLYERIRSYFVNKEHDWKIAGLIKEYATVETIHTHTEEEALLLEATLIGQHKPKYNTLLKEGNPFVYIMITKGILPDLLVVRTKKDKGVYFGPFLQKKDARAVVTFLKNTFQLHRCNKTIANGCLQYHLGLCAGTCKTDFNKDEYLFRVALARDVLRQNASSFLKSIEQKMAECSKALEYEKARNLQKYREQCEIIFATIKAKFSFEKYAHQVEVALSVSDTKAFFSTETASLLQQFLSAAAPVHTIDCFDISHFQGQEIVGSCIRFRDGVPDKQYFRKFLVKTVTAQNDYAALQEIVSRRYKEGELPDLIVIDGGKGQLSAVRQILPDALVVSLAKREETLFGTFAPEGVVLDVRHPVGKLFIALRDYAHHFAISYHRVRRKKNLDT